jgi:hypothetical protein
MHDPGQRDFLLPRQLLQRSVKFARETDRHTYVSPLFGFILDCPSTARTPLHYNGQNTPFSTIEVKGLTLGKCATCGLKAKPFDGAHVAFILNWWSIFTRMVTGSRHGEAITTRPLFQYGAVRQTEHYNQMELSLSSMNASSPGLMHLISPSDRLLLSAYRRERTNQRISGPG